MQSLARIIRLASTSLRLDGGLRRKVNLDLVERGFGGKGSFRSPGQALAEIGDVLQDRGLQWDTVLNAQLFQGNSGKRALDIAFRNEAEPMSPTSISNSVLSFSWYERESGSYEIIAHLS